ncbi:MAG: SGNH/GDSL hydrolase family protein [Acidobacteria bacterium]|nr:SGNH/GDSL hydrolase family protein [Acidobacteriota bacterium]
MSTWLVAGVSFLLGCAMLLAAVRLFRRAWTTASQARTAALNLAIVFFTLFFGGLAAEVLVYCFFVQSYQSGFVLANQRWMDRYWKPVNRKGYRDLERAEGDFLGKRIVAVAGDSFAAGYGIADYRRRFSNVLEDNLGPGWVVVNLAKNGWDTSAEFKAVRSFPHKPDVIVLGVSILRRHVTLSRSIA